MKFGVCYYPEHWDPSRWKMDAKMMRQAGISIVRIAEFAWALMEPQEGHFEWHWLDEAVDILSAEGLDVVLGTPTATPPAWLVRAHPEILPVDEHGARREFGSRRHYCPTSPVYRDYSRRIVSAMAERYGNHPGVTAWQIDNEFGDHETGRCYCPACAEAFRNWLRQKYCTLDALNQAWGNVFWSQIYTAWDQIEPPIRTVTVANPSHTLDYDRFSSTSFEEFQQQQVDILREVSPDRRLTTNFMGTYAELDYQRLQKPLDFISWDSYPTGQMDMLGDGLYFPWDQRPTFAYDVGDPYISGLGSDLTRSLKRQPYWIMEQQIGQINWANYNPGIRPGTMRLWAWHALASGAEAIVYFRWRACLYAQEQYHSGLLNHDASPAQGYRELVEMQSERADMDAWSEHPFTASAAILIDYADLWALQSQPHNRDYQYWRVIFRYYRAMQSLGLAVDLVAPTDDLTRYSLVIAPALLIGSGEKAKALTAYVSHGGTLLMGVRSGFKTPSSMATDQPLPGAYRTLTGAVVADWHSLPPGVGFNVKSAIEGLDGQIGTWMEQLLPDADVETLAQYTEGPFAGQAALTRHEVGKGKVWSMGWLPSHAQTRALLLSLCHNSGIQPVMDLPDGVIVSRRGDDLLLLNFTDQSQTVGKVIIHPREVAWVRSSQAGEA